MIVVSWICLLASPVFGAARTGIAGGIPTSPEDGLWSKEGLRSKEGRPQAAPGDGR
jgi:hypothetical protein